MSWGAVPLAILIIALAWQQGRPRPLPAAISVLGRTALWLSLVQRSAAPYGIPAALELGLIAHESHGNYQATGADANGTVDAGLTQINSGPQPGDAHWAEYGLAQDPVDPVANVGASLRILSADVQRYGGVRPALLAYNAGTPAAGLRYAPAYPGDVLGYARQLEAGPVLAAWPSGGAWSAAGTAWQATVPAVGLAGYVVVSAVAPTGAARTYAGSSWGALGTAEAVTVREGMQVRQAFGCGVAPADLRAAMPPDACYWWAPLRLAPRSSLRVEVAAVWEAPGTGHRVLRATTSLLLRALPPG